MAAAAAPGSARRVSWRALAYCSANVRMSNEPFIWSFYVSMPKCSHLACSHLRTNLSRFDQTDQRAPPRCTTGRLLAAAQRRTLQRTRLKHSARCSAPVKHSASYAGVAMRSTTGTACTNCRRTTGAATHECSESRAQPPRDGARRGTSGRCVLEGLRRRDGRCVAPRRHDGPRCRDGQGKYRDSRTNQRPREGRLQLLPAVLPLYHFDSHSGYLRIIT